MTRLTLSDFEQVLGSDDAREIAEQAFVRALAPGSALRCEHAAANLRAAGIDPTDREAVRQAYEDALFDACAGGGC